MLNQTAEYALRVVVHLAELPPNESARAATLAATLDVPANYLSKILHQLATEGILRSRRGRNGGFRLARPAVRLSLARVIAPFDTIGHRRCVLGRPSCKDADPCQAHAKWRPVSTSLTEFLTRTTVADLLPGGPPPKVRARASA